jgi:hypothetical protein
MATYTLKSAVASVTATSGTPSPTADLFTATGQTVVKSIVCNYSTGNYTSTPVNIKIQKSGGSAYTIFTYIPAAPGYYEMITKDGSIPNNYLVLETGDKLIINPVRGSNDLTMTAVASYTVIS